jgi:hypothetical protein
VSAKANPQVFTEVDGGFLLEGVPNAEPFTLVLQKGYFRRVLELTVPACGELKLTVSQTSLPGKLAQHHALDTVPRIAVVTGAWDKLEKVLTKIGVEEITIYEGKNLGTGPTSMQALLQNGALLRSYQMLLINCGTHFEDLVTTAGGPRNNLREYVREGGRLFVTDYSYDFVEQAFPEFADFWGSDGTKSGTPEVPNEAEVGTDGLVVNGHVVDPSLAAWLGLPQIQALADDGSIKLEGFQTGWAVISQANPSLATKVWVEGPVKWVGGSGEQPLAISYDFKDDDQQGCGRITFSSYHTWGEATALLPQERVLEYLALELGSCRALK